MIVFVIEQAVVAETAFAVFFGKDTAGTFASYDHGTFSGKAGYRRKFRGNLPFFGDRESAVFRKNQCGGTDEVRGARIGWYTVKFLKELYSKAEVIERDGGYWIIACTK